MGIREKLNDNPKLAFGVGVTTLAVAALAIVSQLSGGGGPTDQAFFTTDDGQTWFADDADKLPPFGHEGKEAVRAYVFVCNGKEFVNHLERFTPERRKFMEATIAAKTAGTAPPAIPAGSAIAAGQEVKRPGGKNWVSTANFSKAGPVLQPKCPDGSGEALPVEP